MTKISEFAGQRPAPDHRPPTEEELGRRIARLSQALEEQGLDYYVAVSPDNVFYLTNFANYIHERPFVLVISRSGDLRFLVPKLELPHVRCRAVGSVELVAYDEFPAPVGERWSDRFQMLIPPRAKVGLESTCPYFIAAELTGETVCTDPIDDLRMVKSTYELARIQYACDLASSAHEDFLQHASVGLTLREANSRASQRMMGALIADQPSLNIFATKVALVFQPPSVSHDPHNFTDIHMVMEPGGPHISIINGVMNGYGTEIERTFFLDRAPEAAKRPFAVMMEAREAALACARPGNPMSEVDKAANAVFRAAGYGQNLLHRAGHGIGVTGHEGPFFAEGYDREILPGMVFTIEPGVYLPGIGGFRHSDTLFISEEGPVLMTEGPLELEELVLG